MNRFIKYCHPILNNPLINDVFQTCVGSYKFRKKFINTLPLKKNTKIVELGCGTGIALKYLGNIDYIGIDISSKFLSKANSRNESSKLILGSVENIETYNSILSTKPNFFLAMGLWHHLNDDQFRETLLNINEISDKESVIFCFDPIIVDTTTKAAAVVARNDRGSFLRKTGDYETFGAQTGWKCQYKISRNDLYIPSDIITTIFTKSTNV